MNTSELEGFRYADMKACLVNIQYGVNITATFRIFLPPNSNDERIYEECERIPVDIMFRYLVAIHHNLTVVDLDARVVMANSDVDTPEVLDQYALYVTCRCFYCNQYLQSLMQQTSLFTASTDGVETIHTSTFIDTIPIYTSKDITTGEKTTVNGIFHITSATYRELPPVLHCSRMRPYGISINIKCINAQALEVSGIKYDIYEHNSIYKIINDIIKETVGILYTWMIYETTSGFKPLKDMMHHTTYHFIHEANDPRSQQKPNQLSLYVVCVPDGLFNLKFGYSTTGEIACVPYDGVNKKLIQYQDLNWALPQKTFEPLMRRMESLHSYLMSTPDFTFVSQCVSCSRKAIDDVMYFTFSFEPAVINWATGISDRDSISAISRDTYGVAMDTTLCDYLICRSFEGFEIAFPMNGQNPRRGVLFYVRYPVALNINNIRQAFPLTHKVPIYSRIISVVSGYVTMQFMVDGIYDTDTLGIGDLDVYFPDTWFPTVNDDTMMQSRGEIKDWVNLPKELKTDTVKFLILLTNYMVSFQINEGVMMNTLGVSSHEGILHAWMNCVGLPNAWREFMDTALHHIMNPENPPKKSWLARIFGG